VNFPDNLALDRTFRLALQLFLVTGERKKERERERERETQRKKERES
jgi:hypothetical protein